MTGYEESMKALVEGGVAIALTMASIKMMMKLYEENPSFFWSYYRKENESLIYNCRM